LEGIKKQQMDELYKQAEAIRSDQQYHVLAGHDPDGNW
jgi:hypothetical protein